MGLFGKKKEKEVEAPVVEVAKENSSEKKTDKKAAAPRKGKHAVRVKGAQKAAIVVPKSLTSVRNLSQVIVRPRITEKAAVVGDNNVYTFEVHSDATKYDVRDAVKELFKVTPVRVNIVIKKPRTKMSRGKGRKVSQPGLKKAYVYLKKDDRIDLV